MNPSANHYSKWVVVGVIWLIACLNYTDRMTIFSVFPVLKREMGLSNVGLAMLGSAFLWVYGFFSPLGGYLGDRFARKPVILSSLVIFSMVTFATGLARTGGQLIGLRYFLGISEAVFLPPALAYVADYHSDRTRSLANSIVLSGLTAGAGLGSWYGGYLTEHYTWRIGFFLLGSIGLLLTLIAGLILRNDSIAPADLLLSVEYPGESIGVKVFSVLKTPSAVALIFLAFALSLTSWPTTAWLPTYLYENFGLTLTLAGSVVTFFAALPALVGGVAGGAVADRWTKRDSRGRMAIQVLGFAVMGPAILAIGFMPSVRAVATDLLVYSIARGMLECNSMPLFCSVVPRSRWSTAYGLYNLAGTLAGGLGIFFVGLQKPSWGVGRTLSSMSTLLFIGAVVMGIIMFRCLPSDIRRQQEREGAEQALAFQPVEPI